MGDGKFSAARTLIKILFKYYSVKKVSYQIWALDFGLWPLALEIKPKSKVQM